MCLKLQNLLNINTQEVDTLSMSLAQPDQSRACFDGLQYWICIRCIAILDVSRLQWTIQQLSIMIIYNCAWSILIQ